MLFRLTSRSPLIWLPCLLLGICWASPVKEKQGFFFKHVTGTENLLASHYTLGPVSKSRRAHPHPCENQEKNLRVNLWSTQCGQLQQAASVGALTFWNPGWCAQNSESYGTCWEGQLLPGPTGRYSLQGGQCVTFPMGPTQLFRDKHCHWFWNQNLSEVNVTYWKSCS